MGKGSGVVPGEAVSSDSEGALDGAEIARREALKRLGIFGAYTTPAMMVLLSSDIATAQFATSGGTN